MSIRRSTRFPRTSLAVVLLAVGCREPLVPASVAGAYVLREVANDALPTLRYTTDYVRVQVLADTIRLRADGTGTLASLEVTESLVTAAAPPAPRLSHSEVFFRVNGHRIEITHYCPPNANCVAGPHLIAVPTDDGLTVEWVAGTGRVPLTYSRFSDTP